MNAKQILFPTAIAAIVVASSVEVPATPKSQVIDHNQKANVVPIQNANEIKPVVEKPAVEIKGNYAIEQRGKTLRYTGSIELTIRGVMIKSKGKDAWLEVRPDGFHLSPHGWITTLQ